MVEVHHEPDKALSDGAQSIYPEQLVQMMDECTQIAQVLHRNLPHGIEVLEAAGIAKRDR
jgi:3-deoxy-7-phosphoheptulonate synthase